MSLREAPGASAWRGSHLCNSLVCSKTVGGCCDDEFMKGDHHNSTALARAAVADARREAAAAMARLAEAAVRYADCRIAEDTAAGVGSKKPQRVTPGEFVADELSLLLRDQPYPVRCSTGPCPTPNTTDAPMNHYPQDRQPEPQTRYRRVLQAFCGNPRLSPP